MDTQRYNGGITNLECYNDGVTRLRSSPPHTTEKGGKYWTATWQLKVRDVVRGGVSEYDPVEYDRHLSDKPKYRRESRETRPNEKDERSGRGGF